MHASDEEVDTLLTRAPAGNTDVKQPQDALVAKLEAALEDGDKKGPNINQKLAEIVKHKWARKMSQEILGKYVQPQNCPDIAVAHINPETCFQKKGDLKIANMQQALQKATFAIASSCNSILTVKTDNRTPDDM